MFVQPYIRLFDFFRKILIKLQSGEMSVSCMLCQNLA